MTKRRTLKKKGEGFPRHRHDGTNDHDFAVIEGEVTVQTRGFTHYLKAGDRIVHRGAHREAARGWTQKRRK